MKKIFAAILCLIISCGLLAGCGQQEPAGSGNEEAQALRLELNGSWSQITEDGSPSLPDMGIPSGYVFYLDGTGIDTFWDMTFVYSTDGETLHIAYDDSIGEDWDYFYAIEGDVLTLTRADDDAITLLYQKVPENESLEPESMEPESMEPESTP